MSALRAAAAAFGIVTESPVWAVHDGLWDDSLSVCCAASDICNEPNL